MDATALAQLVDSVQSNDIKAKCTGLFVIRRFSQFQRNTLEKNNVDGYLDRIFGGQFPGYDSD